MLALGGGAAAAAVLLPLLTFAPNRLLSGRPLDWSAFPTATLALSLGLAGLVALCGLARRTPAASAAAFLAAIVAPAVLLWAAGQVAAAQAGQHAAAARTSLGAGTWLFLLLSYLASAEAARGWRPAWRAAGLGLAVLPIAWLLAGGGLDHLSILREYQAKSGEFADALLRHAEIVGLVLGPALLGGVPLGVVCHLAPRLRGPVLLALGLIQTIPSIALFGLLLVPLSKLAAAFPWIGQLGVGGVGMAPAVVALTLYALLPVVRNTADGLAMVPASVIDAGSGMGMRRGQLLLQVEMPLALPLILAGVRITVVQTVGLAAVAALIGAGGLGALMFQGLSADAQDLVLLGAVPVLVLALGADLLFRLAAAGLGDGRA